MRLNNDVKKCMFDSINEARKVSRLNFTEKQFSDMCFTINAINGLSYGKSLIGDYLVSDYVIPKVFQDLIVPVRIKFSNDEYSTDYKSEKYREQAMLPYTTTVNNVDIKITPEMMTPESFQLVWIAILGALKAKLEFTGMTELRQTILLHSVGDSLQPDISDEVRDLTPYVPRLISIQPYQKEVYTMDGQTVFLRWWINKLASL